MRVLHEQKSRKLKRLDEKGAETHKIDATRTLVRNLSTKIRIAIQVVDKISVKINNLRDEELWPQLNEFIEGYVNVNTFFVNSSSLSCGTVVIVWLFFTQLKPNYPIFFTLDFSQCVSK